MTYKHGNSRIEVMINNNLERENEMKRQAKQKEERKEKIYATLEAIGLVVGLFLMICEPVELWGFAFNFIGLFIAFISVKLAIER